MDFSYQQHRQLMYQKSLKSKTSRSRPLGDLTWNGSFVLSVCHFLPRWESVSLELTIAYYRTWSVQFEIDKHKVREITITTGCYHLLQHQSSWEKKCRRIRFMSHHRHIWQEYITFRGYGENHYNSDSKKLRNLGVDMFSSVHMCYNLWKFQCVTCREL